MIKKSVAAFLLLSLLAACHTIQGAGQDLSATGRAVSNTAEKVAPK